MSALPPEDTAVISDCGTYRYLLTRRVGPEVHTATFVMLNPSTADAMTDDPTIRRCRGFARAWGCGRLVVLNLFAFRATKPEVMKKAADPVGPENRAWFERVLRDRCDGPVVCAWGTHGAHKNQDLEVLGWLRELGVGPVALRLTLDGHPWHPLLVPADTEPIPFTGRKS